MRTIKGLHFFNKGGILLSKKIGYYRANTNIALIKYWGKRNKELFLPMTSSLSLTLDAFYTDTKVTVDSNLSQDYFTLDGVAQSYSDTQKVSKFVDLFRKLAGSQEHVYIESVNHVPTAAGLASSASAYSALACALNQAFNLNLDQRTLSTLARQGSGSASRSLFGGFVEWHKGEGDNSDSSYAEQIADADWDIAMLVIVINDQKKKISSRVGMEHTIQTSPFFALWPQEVEKDLALIKQAIKDKDFKTLGEVTEHNAMKMHATTIAANPSLTYWAPASITALHAVQSLREDLGFECYATMDAGPNVKVLCRKSEIDALSKQLLTHFKPDQLIKAYPGEAPRPLPID